MSTYKIRIPGRLHTVLLDRDAFTCEAEAPELAAFKSATPERAGNGTSWTIESEDLRSLVGILDYVHSLGLLLQGGLFTAKELGIGYADLRRVADQSTIPTKPVRK